MRPLVLEESELLHCDLVSFLVTVVYIGKASSIRGTTDRANIDTMYEEGCGKDACVRRELDQQVECMSIELVVESNLVQHL
jgi:hypothetical protein